MDNIRDLLAGISQSEPAKGSTFTVELRLA
jgi:hypothetical protein